MMQHQPCAVQRKAASRPQRPGSPGQRHPLQYDRRAGSAAFSRSSARKAALSRPPPPRISSTVPSCSACRSPGGQHGPSPPSHHLAEGGSIPVHRKPLLPQINPFTSKHPTWCATRPGAPIPPNPDPPRSWYRWSWGETWGGGLKVPPRPAPPPVGGRSAPERPMRLAPPLPVRFTRDARDDRAHHLAHGLGLRRRPARSAYSRCPAPMRAGASVPTSASAAMRPASRSAAR